MTDGHLVKRTVVMIHPPVEPTVAAAAAHRVMTAVQDGAQLHTGGVIPRDLKEQIYQETTAERLISRVIDDYLTKGGVQEGVTKEGATGVGATGDGETGDGATGDGATGAGAVVAPEDVDEEEEGRRNHYVFSCHVSLSEDYRFTFYFSNTRGTVDFCRFNS